MSQGFYLLLVRLQQQVNFPVIYTYLWRERTYAIAWVENRFFLGWVVGCGACWRVQLRWQRACFGYSLQIDPLVLTDNEHQ